MSTQVTKSDIKKIKQAYYKEWRKKNAKKIKAYNERYWAKKAAGLIEADKTK